MPTNVNTNGVVFTDSTTQNTASDYKQTTFTANGTWTADKSGLKALRVTVVGGGGNGGNASGLTQGKAVYSSRSGGGGSGGFRVAWVDGPSVPASPVAVTVALAGGTSSFGTLVTATGGATAPSVGGGASSPTGGGGAGGSSTAPVSPDSNCVILNGMTGLPGSASLAGPNIGGDGGSVRGIKGGEGGIAAGVLAATGFGSGGGGTNRSGPGTNGGGAGTGGVVIVEEFY